jgi:bifunctional DNA-binding transcriptional regulator/antitoxin component of YhaV-PrlF toxin-antitoxin module
METFTSFIEFDFVNDEYLITFPPKLLDHLEWKKDDTLQFIINEDKSCTIIKIVKPDEKY